MSGVVVLLHLVVCEPNLLICEDLEIPQVVFRDVVACNEMMPRAIEVARQARAPNMVVMGRCRFGFARQTPPPPPCPDQSSRPQQVRPYRDRQRDEAAPRRD